MASARRFGGVPASRRPTSDDRVAVVRIVLSGVAEAMELADLAAQLVPFHPKHNTFPAEVLLQLSADAIEESGATREQPIEFADIRKCYLPECVAHTKAQHHKSEYALRAAAMVRGGVDPGLLEEVVWWQSPQPRGEHDWAHAAIAPLSPTRRPWSQTDRHVA